MKEPLSQKDLLQRVVLLMEAHGARYRKKTFVEAKPAQGGEQIKTVTSDGEETVNRAAPGDFIVRNRTQAQERYVVTEEVFRKKYRKIEPLQEGYALYRAVGYVYALELTAPILEALQVESPFHFVAAWGAAIVAKEGDFLVMPDNKAEVYRIARREFGETYELMTE
jgi:hypothetical protein